MDIYMSCNMSHVATWGSACRVQGLTSTDYQDGSETRMGTMLTMGVSIAPQPQARIMVPLSRQETWWDVA